jgi:3-hydroxypropanoate dehydrogenase
MKWGPTSANCSPARFVFVRSPAQKAALVACVGPGNVKKVEEAPVTAVIGMDMAFYDKLPFLFPHTDARSWFAGHPHKIEQTAMRNSSLQGGYFILAARAFWAGTTVKTNFICTLGEGDPSKVFARSPRLPFEEACKIV